MNENNNKAFTLIEVIVALVILSIIMLIAIPFLRNIIDKSREMAYKRSVDAYGKSIELAIASYLIDKGSYPTDISQLKINYTGEKVSCDYAEIIDNTKVYLTHCYIGDTKVIDSKSSDGWYHFGGNLKKEYSIGDKIVYKNVNFYVIANSEATDSKISLMKAEAFTLEEIFKYGIEGEYEFSTVDTYGGNEKYPSIKYLQCNNDCDISYNSSSIKKIVDAWTKDIFQERDLAVDSMGYKSRLITFDDLTNNLGYELQYVETSLKYKRTSNSPKWISNIENSSSYSVYNNRNSNMCYWTMSNVNDNNYLMWCVGIDGSLKEQYYSGYALIRPVVTISKAAIK